MRRLTIRTRFKRDMKLARKRRMNIDKMEAVIDDLQAGRMLAPKHRPHILTGEWYGNMECHIEPDWLLIYQLTPEGLILVRTGTHSDLFK
jgi:mRNA interferase YafQ